MTRRDACVHLPFAPLFVVALAVALGVSARARGADDPVGAAMKLYEKRRYEQAARLLEEALARLEAERRPQAQLVLGMIYLRNADLHEAFGRTAAAAELDYLDKLLRTRTEDRSRYARLHLAEALLARGNASEARRHFEQVRADSGIEKRFQAIASVGLGSVLWAQRDAKGARGVWAGAGGAAEIALARAADLGMASYVESFKAVKGTAKSINLYDLALLTDLTRLYRELARRQLERAAADARMKPSAEYYLAEVLSGLGASDEALTYVQSFLARPQTPAQYRERALARQALLAHRQGSRAEAESAWTEMAEGASDPEVLADIVLGCSDAEAQCGKVLARVGQVTEAGDGRRYQRLNFALGSYYLRKKNYARAISYMEAGRDKSNKNKIEANDPEMLAGLAEAYYRTKKFSEGLEIFFEMSKEFPVVRQIQEAMQGVYSLEQRSAGDVKIL